MNSKEFTEQNISIFNTLGEFISILPNKQEYLILGSIALISYTKKINYFRKIKDIDVIVNKKYKKEITDTLLKKGYQKLTFIDKKMPFYKNLIKHSKSMYTRFYKPNGVNIEILFTNFTKSKDRLEIELYPKIFASLPLKVFNVSNLNNTKFNSISPEALLTVKKLTNNTIGRIYTKDKQKRNNDIFALSKVINKNIYKTIKKELKFRMGFISFKISKIIS